MAPLPKRKRSKSRKRTRRAHWGVKPRSLSPCPDCPDGVKLPHMVCPKCGSYNGRQVVEVSPAEE